MPRGEPAGGRVSHADVCPTRIKSHVLNRGGRGGLSRAGDAEHERRRGLWAGGLGLRVALFLTCVVGFVQAHFGVWSLLSQKFDWVVLWWLGSSAALAYVATALHRCIVSPNRDKEDSA